MHTLTCSSGLESATAACTLVSASGWGLGVLYEADLLVLVKTGAVLLPVPVPCWEPSAGGAPLLWLSTIPRRRSSGSG